MGLLDKMRAYVEVEQSFESMREAVENLRELYTELSESDGLTQDQDEVFSESLSALETELGVSEPDSDSDSESDS